MKWTIEYYSQDIQKWIDELPVSIKAAYARLTSLLIEFGMSLHLPHSRALGQGLFELRPKGREGIARVFYCTLVGGKIVMLHGFVKKTQKTPQKELILARHRMREVKDEKQKN